jgi:deazaflavin-dependent oxidoreductase (nitroreductase family)
VNDPSGEKPSRSFPAPGTPLYGILCDPEYKRTFHNRVKQGNRFMAPLYKLGVLPLFGMGRQIMLLTTLGRKSRQLRDTPIGYFRLDDVLTVFSGWGKAANWYQNLVACPDEVYVQVGFHRFHVLPEVVEDPGERKRLIEQLVLQDPQGAKMLMGWDPASDRLEEADFTLMVEKVLVVRFYEG